MCFASMLSLGATRHRETHCFSVNHSTFCPLNQIKSSQIFIYYRRTQRLDFFHCR